MKNVFKFVDNRSFVILVSFVLLCSLFLLKHEVDTSTHVTQPLSMTSLRVLRYDSALTPRAVSSLQMMYRYNVFVRNFEEMGVCEKAWGCSL